MFEVMLHNLRGLPAFPNPALLALILNCNYEISQRGICMPIVLLFQSRSIEKLISILL